MQALQCNRPLTDLTSQNGGKLDPWDELTASWKNDDVTRAPATRSRNAAVNSVRGLSVPVDLGVAKTQREFHKAVTEGDRPTDGILASEHRRHVQISLEQENSADPILPVKLGLPKTQREFHNAVKEGDRPTDGSQGTEHRRHVEISLEMENSADPMGSENEDESGRDVAAAIEGLLAQTSKVRTTFLLSSSSQIRLSICKDRNSVVRTLE